MIKVLLFAHLSEEIGKREVEIEAVGFTIAKLKNKLLEIYPTLPLAHVFTAVNEEYVTEETVLKSGDVVAFIPPVSGG